MTVPSTAIWRCCVKVAEAQPRLLDGRYLLFRVPETFILPLDVQKWRWRKTLMTCQSCLETRYDQDIDSPQIAC
jgi:hypothetical protein